MHAVSVANCKHKECGYLGQNFHTFAFDFYNYVNILMKSCSKMVLGLTQSSMKEKKIDRLLRWQQQHLRLSQVTPYRATWDSTLMTYNLM